MSAPQYALTSTILPCMTRPVRTHTEEPLLHWDPQPPPLILPIATVAAPLPYQRDHRVALNMRRSPAQRHFTYRFC